MTVIKEWNKENVNKKKFYLACFVANNIWNFFWWFVGRQNDSQNAETPAYLYQLVECSSIISTLEGVGTRPCDR